MPTSRCTSCTRSGTGRRRRSRRISSARGAKRTKYCGAIVGTQSSIGVKLHAMAARNCFVVCYMSYSVCCMLAYADRARSLVFKAEGSNHCCDLAATQKLWPSPPRPSACCTLRFCCTLHLYVARCMWSAARPSVTRCLPSCSSACSSTRIRWVADCPFVARVARCIVYLHIQCVLGSAHAARCGIGWC